MVVKSSGTSTVNASIAAARQASPMPLDTRLAADRAGLGGADGEALHHHFREGTLTVPGTSITRRLRGR